MAANENGVQRPSYERYAEGNGVAMPGPQSTGYELGFDGVGRDMRDVVGSPAMIVGVQLPGGPNEQGWGFGEDYECLQELQQEPPTNQEFGVFESPAGDIDGDDALGTRVLGTLGSNTAGVLTSDILRVFGAVATNDQGNVGSPTGGTSGFDSMRGIPLGPGSGTYIGGVQNSNSTEPARDLAEAGGRSSLHNDGSEPRVEPSRYM